MAQVMKDDNDDNKFNNNDDNDNNDDVKDQEEKQMTEEHPTNEDGVSFKMVDDKISAYYQEMRRNDYRMNDGDGLFLNYCDEEAFDIDDLKEDLFGDAEDSQLLEFDDNFPLNDDNTDNKKQEIQKVLIKLYNECKDDASNDQTEIEKMDDLINEYYQNNNVHSYKQQFLKYCEKEDYTIDNLNDEFADDVDAENCEYVSECLGDFPFSDDVKDDDRANTKFEVLKGIYNQIKNPNKNAKSSIDKPNVDNNNDDNNDDDDEKKYDNNDDVKQQQGKPNVNNNNDNDDDRPFQNKFRRHNNTIIKTFEKFHPFEVTEDGREEIKTLYKDEFFIKNEANDDQTSDQILIDWFTLGYQNNYPTLVMNLSASCTRDKLYHEINTDEIMNTKQWIESKSSLKRNLSVSQKNRLQHAIDSYVKRICTPLEVSDSLKINDSLREICIRVAVVSCLIKHILENDEKFRTLRAPFQLDFMIVVEGTTTVENMVSIPVDDDDDADDVDDYDDNNNPSQEICDIENKLKANDCYFFSKRIDNMPPNIINGTKYFVAEIYQKFRDHFDFKKAHTTATLFPRNRRVCLFLDRRHNDTLTIFDPPSNCNKLSENTRIPESFFTNLHKCLIPSMEYNKEVDNKEEKMETIRMKSACDGNLMTFSFHVEQRDEIRCFFMWNGRCIRFCPNDMFGFLPKFFNMNYGQNAENQVFALSQEIHTIASSTLIADVAFDAFYTSL